MGMRGKKAAFTGMRGKKAAFNGMRGRRSGWVDYDDLNAEGEEFANDLHILNKRRNSREQVIKAGHKIVSETPL